MSDSSDDNPLDPAQESPGAPAPRPDLFNGAPLVPGNRGNTGGKPGRSGRLPRAWKEFCHSSLTDPEVQAAIMRRALKGHPAILKLLADHGEGAPEQRISLAADTGALDRLFARLAPQAPADTPR